MLGFPGTLYPVNRKNAAILGRTVYPSLAAIPGPVDAAVIAIPAAGVPAIVEEAGKQKIPLVIIVSSGFREQARPGKRSKTRCLPLHGNTVCR